MYIWLEKHPDASKAIRIGVLLSFIALGVYIRAIPALKYGLELQGNDPWIEYWTTNYTYTHGLLSWWSLTQSNPVTHIFWYPWGRDFTLSTYPGMTLVAAATYPLVQPLHITLKDWVALQPLLYAVLSTILVYLAVRELMDGSELAGLIAALLYAVLPAAADRTMIGFVEKEGAGATFIFLFIYLYSKMIKIDHCRDPKKKLLYAILSGLAMAMVGWFWGGYQYLFTAFSLFMVVYPLVSREKLTLRFILYNLEVSLSSLLFVALAPKNYKALGLIPTISFKLGVMALALYTLPLIYYIGVKKKILNPWRYLGLLVVIGIASVYIISMGYIHVSGRIAYALGLRYLVHEPLVYSVEEHQPALQAHGLVGVLNTWGGPPFLLSIIGALYLLYKGRADHLLTATLFFIAFYAYMNATYFEALAAAFGVITNATLLGFLLKQVVPSKKEIERRRRGVVTLRERFSPGRVIALILLVLISIPTVTTIADNVEKHQYMIPSIMSSASGFGKNPAWYEAIDFLRNSTGENALIISWWDYGYWIGVCANRASVADGATLNSSQIRLLAQFLTSFNESEALDILRKLHAPEDETYVLVFDVFWFLKTGENQYVVQPFDQYTMAGRIDIPKSIWMIRIGRRDPADYLYLYVIQAQQRKRAIVSPRFDKPETLPLIYKMMVDGILYLNEQEVNQTYMFRWYTGSETSLEPAYQPVRDYLGVETEIQASTYSVLMPQDRSRSSMVHFKPYKIIVSSYNPPIQSQDGNAELRVVIFIYKVDFTGSP